MLFSYLIEIFHYLCTVIKDIINSKNITTMKQIRIISIMALSAIFVCCANTSTKKTDKEATKDNAAAVEMKETSDTPTDVKSFGLVGNVKEVKVTVTDITSGTPDDPWEDAVQRMEFDKNGKVVKDWFDNHYKYDDKGNFIYGVSEKSIMRRDDKGRIVFYENWKDEEDDEGFTIKIEYDEKDRMAKVQLVGWESTVDQTFTYTDDHIYPDRLNWESEDEGDHYSTVMTYTYKKLDSKGNWTEREIHTISKHTIEDDPEVDTEESKSIEQREIIYY